MDLSLSQEETDFQQEVRSWLEETLPEGSPYRGLNLFTQSRDDFAWWQKTLDARGWGCVGWPEEYGGTGWTDAQKQIFSTECSRVEAPMQSPFGETMVGPVIYTFGSQELKDAHLENIRNGSTLWCQGYSEPGSGSDLASVRTSAIRDGDDYVVNGQKIWTTQAHFADWIFCLVRTKTDCKPQEGISFLLIDMKTPGVEVKPIYSIDGEHHLNEVYFSEVRVPASNLVGEENMGWTYAKFLLMNERVGIAGTGRLRSGLGNLRAVHDYLAETAADSYDTEDLGRKHAELSVRLDALEALESRALTAEEGSGESMILPLPLKLLGTHLQQDVADLGNEILAYSSLPRTGHGFGENDASNEPPIRAGGPQNMSFMLSGRASTIYGGTSEVQRGIMSKFVLGL